MCQSALLIIRQIATYFPRTNFLQKASPHAPVTAADLLLVLMRFHSLSSALLALINLVCLYQSIFLALILIIIVIIVLLTALITNGDSPSSPSPSSSAS